MAAAMVLIASCGANYDAATVVPVVKELRSVLPAIQVGLILGKASTPTSKALDPVNNPPTGWPYGTQTPAQVYSAAGGTTGTVRIPATGYYTMSNGDQIYVTMAPETALGPTYYRIFLHTYPAVDVSVSNTVEEYIVNSAGTQSWQWGNLDMSLNANSFVSLKTAYLDGTNGTRTLVWNSNQSAPSVYYAAFTVTTPDPTVTSSFVGYRYEEALTSPSATATGMSYSSNVTEEVSGKGTTAASTQYYTENSATVHSGLTYVSTGKKSKWSTPTKIVARMQEDTGAGTKTIRSVGEVSSSQYYIDKVDISKVGGLITYTSTHDVYYSSMPRGLSGLGAGLPRSASVNPNASQGEAMSVTEDGPGAGTYTGTMEKVQGSSKVTYDVTIGKDSSNSPIVKLRLSSTGATALDSAVDLPITGVDLSSLTIAVPALHGTFTGYYESGSLFGTLATSRGTFDVVVANEGVAVDGTLFPY
jgi:hypothetical protein